MERLILHHSILIDLLHSLEDDPRLMDASLEDVHELATLICRIVKRNVFGPHGPLDPFSRRDIYDRLDCARVDESDVYEVYAEDLERYQRRQRKDLGVAELDSDKFAVVKRRREYICTLAALQTQLSGVLDVL